jgi:hypothetical protein
MLARKGRALSKTTHKTHSRRRFSRDSSHLCAQKRRGEAASNTRFSFSKEHGEIVEIAMQSVIPFLAHRHEKAARQRNGLFFRENSSNGGKAIRTFWRNTMFGGKGCQGKIQKDLSDFESIG